MANNLTNYSYRFPEITSITNLKEARSISNSDGSVGAFVINFTRKGGYTSAGTYVYCVIGNRGEKLDYVPHHSTRWKKVSGFTQSGTTITVTRSNLVSAGFPNEQINDVFVTRRAIHFMLFEKINYSYAGLANLLIVPNTKKNGKVTAYSVRNQVIGDRYYKQNGVVWDVGSLFSEGDSAPVRVAVDLAQNIEKPSDRTRRVWVTSNKGGIACLDYYTGEKIGALASNNGNLPIYAMAVNPYDNMLYYVVPVSDGKGLNLMRAKVTTENGRATLSYEKYIKSKIGDLAYPFSSRFCMFPTGSTAQTVAEGITGGVITRGASSGAYFTFIVGKEFTVTISLSDKSITWSDRMHFGSWHGSNAYYYSNPFKLKNHRITATPEEGTGLYTYGYNVEYGVAPNTPNVVGICGGLFGGVYVNGHQYYHYDSRKAVEFSVRGYTLNNTFCGRHWKSGFKYPSFEFDEVTGEWLMNEDGTPKVVKKHSHDAVGWPVNGMFFRSKDDGDDSSFYKAIIDDICNGSKKGHPAGGRTCRFGWYSKWSGEDGDYSESPKISESKRNELIDAYSSRVGGYKAEKASSINKGGSWSNDISIHMTGSTTKKSKFFGSHWYFLQNLGYVYFANSSYGGHSAAAKTFTGPKDRYFFSNGVCEDNPAQTGITTFAYGTKPKRKGFDFGVTPESSENVYDINVKTKKGDVYVVGNAFAYQKTLYGKSNGNEYFSTIPLPTTWGKHGLEQFPGGTSTDATSAWGFSEDWSVRKYSSNLNDSETTFKAVKNPVKPDDAQCLAYGIEETLGSDGSLTADGTGRTIFQSVNNTIYALKYGRAYNDGTPSISHALSVNGTDNIGLSGIVRVYGMAIGDVNEIYCNYGAKASGSSTGIDNWGVLAVCRFNDWTNHSYSDVGGCSGADKYVRYSSLGNNHCSHSLIEAYLLKNATTNGQAANYMTAKNWMKSQTAPIPSIGRAYYENTGEQTQIVGKSTQKRTSYNCDPTGMQGIKTLQYCYTNATTVHPVAVSPKGHLYITYTKVNTRGNCYSNPNWWKPGQTPDATFWQKTAKINVGAAENAEAAFLNDVVVPGTASNVDREKVRKYSSTSFDISVSSVGYGPLDTSHLADVYDRGSYAIDEIKFHYAEAPAGTARAAKTFQTERSYSIEKTTQSGSIPAFSSVPGVYQVSYDDSHWVSETVYGKPQMFSKSGTIITQDGQLSPSVSWNDGSETYTFIEPSVAVKYEHSIATETLHVGANNAGNNGYTAPHTVTASAFSLDYPYENPDDPDSTGMKVWNLGKNYIHVYERWPSPGFCAVAVEPSGGLSLWGDCDE